MTEIVKQKMCKVFELATMLNSMPTHRTISENKPTVFMRFFGHVASLEIDIHSMGWGDTAPYDSADYHWSVYLDDNMESIEMQLDNIIELLRNHIERWCKDE